MCESVTRTVNEIGHDEDKLIEVLIQSQSLSEFNYLSKEVIKDIADELGLSETKVYGIANFYSMLSTTKRGRNVIQICNSAPCHIRNGAETVRIFEDILGIKMGEVTEDDLFSIEYTSCIGACDVAPAVRINDQIYGNLDRSKIFNILASVKRGEAI